MSYQRPKALAYAHQWAFQRNPRYYSFDNIGGDCTNFISQCLYAGCGVMNYAKDVGWYYRSASDRSAAWSGVEFLHRFLIHNRGPGPYAEETEAQAIMPGDIVQLSFNPGRYSHSLLVVETGASPRPDNILVATHTLDADYRPLSSYVYIAKRYLHILDSRS